MGRELRVLIPPAPFCHIAVDCLHPPTEGDRLPSGSPPYWCCLGVNICVPQSSYIDVLTPAEMVFGGGALGE